MNLKNTCISNLLLLPKSFRVGEVHKPLVNEILGSHKVFKQLFELEQGIQSVLASLEVRGLTVSKKWFDEGLKEKTSQSKEVVEEINHYIHGIGKGVNQKLLNEFWMKKNLPIARRFEELSNYKELHPTYRLMLQHKKQASFLKQWGPNLVYKGTQLPNGDVKITGSWRSFSSYTGRITAKQLPLTSLPRGLRDYIVAPEGMQLFSLDLSNAELRFLAYYSNCVSLLKKFEEGGDIHSDTGKLIQHEVTNFLLDSENIRELAKTFTYSQLYGASLNTITESLRREHKNITHSDVSNLTAVFNQTYPELRIFLEERGESKSLLTPYGEVNPTVNLNQQQKKNFSLQSGVSVAIKLLMIILVNHKIEISFVLHDEVWVEIPYRTDFETLFETITKEFELEIVSLFRGFPIMGLLTREKLGGE